MKDLEEDDNTLYEVRLTFFGIPLWKVKYTKRELLMSAFCAANKNKIIELIFIDKEGEYDIWYF